MTDDGLEAPIGPVLGGSRRDRERARIGLVAAITIVVLAAGIGLAGNGFTEAPSAAAGPPTATLPVAVVPTPITSPASSQSVPTQSAGLGCTPMGLGAPPEIRLSADAGGIAPVPGLPATPAPSGVPSGETTWPLPSADEAARTTGTAGLNLVPDGDACVESVVADYRPADPSVIGPFPIAWRNLKVSPTRSVVALGPLPSGDWVARVVTTFSTGTAGPGKASVERFFRVIAGTGAGPLATPAAPPAVPCTPLTAGDAPPELTLYGAGESPVAGIPPGTGHPPLIYAIPGAAIEIRASGDACARSWSIQADDIDTGQHLDIETQLNPTSDPFQFAQNRWRFLSVPTGLLQITATMGFSKDVTVSGRWSLIVDADDPPEADVTLPDGTTIAAASGCSATWDYPTGTGITAMCTGEPIVGDLSTIRVPAGVPLRLEVPEWRVLTWNGTCGRLDALDAKTSDPFVVVDSCDLGGSLAAGPIVFLPRASGPVVRLEVTIERQGVLVLATYYLALDPAS